MLNTHYILSITKQANVVKRCPSSYDIIDNNSMGVLKCN